MSVPQWTTPQWATAPSSGTSQPVTIRSSFARPDEPKTAPPPVSTSSSMSRSGFTAKPKSRPRQPAQPTKAADLPPTTSIRASSRSGGDFESISPPRSADSASKPTFSVVVFGFPPGNASKVLKYFSQFGEILENSSDGKSGPASVECGRNWVRIGYSEKQAALKALAQNGQVMPGQYVIGCVCAEPSQQPGLATTSTNTLLLDQSDVSYVQDQSMLSIDESDVTSSGSAQVPQGILASAGLAQTNSTNPTNSTQQSAQSAQAGSSMQTPVKPALSQTNSPSFLASLADESSDRLMPHEPVTGLFAQPKRKAAKEEPVVKQPESVLGKAAQKVSQMLFGWDV